MIRVDIQCWLDGIYNLIGNGEFITNIPTRVVERIDAVLNLASIGSFGKLHLPNVVSTKALYRPVNETCNVFLFIYLTPIAGITNDFFHSVDRVVVFVLFNFTPFHRRNSLHLFLLTWVVSIVYFYIHLYTVCVWPVNNFNAAIFCKLKGIPECIVTSTPLSTIRNGSGCSIIFIGHIAFDIETTIHVDCISRTECDVFRVRTENDSRLAFLDINVEYLWFANTEFILTKIVSFTRELCKLVVSFINEIRYSVSSNLNVSRLVVLVEGVGVVCTNMVVVARVEASLC